MIDMKCFCCDELATLCEPWTLPDGRLAATDSRAAIVVEADHYDGPRDGYKTNGAKRKPPDVLSVVKGFDDVTEWLPFPELPTCVDCKGTGIVEKQECDECDGTGTVTCNLDHDHDCGECGGSGNILNEACVRCLDDEIEIGNRVLSLWQARRVAALPGVVWGLSTTDSQDVVLFRFDGGFGAVCPLKESRKVNR